MRQFPKVVTAAPVQTALFWLLALLMPTLAQYAMARSVELIYRGPLVRDRSGCYATDKSIYLDAPGDRPSLAAGSRFAASPLPHVIGLDVQRGHDELNALLPGRLNNNKPVYLAGGYSTSKTTGEDIYLARFLATGQPDPCFGQRGSLILDVAGGNDRVQAMALVNDGSGDFLIVGSAVNAASSGASQTGKDAVLMRFTEAGQPVAGFGLGGRVVRDFAGGDDELFAVQVVTLADQSQRILVAGYGTQAARSDNSGDTGKDAVLLRFTMTGEPDGEAIRNMSEGEGDDGFHAIQVIAGVSNQPEIIAAGYAHGSADNTRDFLLLRYSVAVQLETQPTQLETNAISEALGHEETLWSLYLDESGVSPKLLTLGVSYPADSASWSQLVLFRYDLQGNLDESFGEIGNGYTTVKSPFFSDGPLPLTVITTSDDTRHILAGKPGAPSCSDNGNVLVSFDDNGQLLSGSNDRFNALFNHFGEGRSAVRAVGVVSTTDTQNDDGRIVLAGFGFGLMNTHCACSTQNDIMLAGFLPDGEPDPCFSTNNSVLTMNGCSVDSAVLADDPSMFCADSATTTSTNTSTTTPLQTSSPKANGSEANRDGDNDAASFHAALGVVSTVAGLSLVSNAVLFGVVAHLVHTRKR